MEFNWDVDSAIWQCKNGEPDTLRTNSAWVFVEAMACGVDFTEANRMANDPELVDD